MPDIEIQTVTPEYEAQIRALSGDTQRIHEARLPHIFYDGGAHQKQLLDIIFDPGVTDNVRAFMALQDEALAGYVLVIPDGAEGATHPINGLIADICVVPDFQRQGIATALLAHCHTEKKRMGWESLRAQVWQGNAASHGLFQAAGYATERTDFRLGTPSVPPEQPKSQVQSPWLIVLYVLMATTLIAYLLG